MGNLMLPGWDSSRSECPSHVEDVGRGDGVISRGGSNSRLLLSRNELLTCVHPSTASRRWLSAALCGAPSVTGCEGKNEVRFGSKREVKSWV